MTHGIIDQGQVIHSFNQLSRFPEKWNHNNHYGKLILAHVPSHATAYLDIGCGTGAFAGKLAGGQRLTEYPGNARKITGIDISPDMIREACLRQQGKNITFIVSDFETYESNDKFDCIVSIAAFHHMNMEIILPKIDSLLNDNGVLIVLDLYKRQGIADRLFDAVAMPVSMVLRIAHKARITREETRLWQEHGKLDRFSRFRELKSIYAKYFPSCRLKKLLFWRYLAVCRKRPVSEG